MNKREVLRLIDIAFKEYFADDENTSKVINEAKQYLRKNLK